MWLPQQSWFPKGPLSSGFGIRLFYFSFIYQYIFFLGESWRGSTNLVWYFSLMGALIEKSTLTEHKVYFVDYIIKVVLERVNIFFSHILTDLSMHESGISSAKPLSNHLEIS